MQEQQQAALSKWKNDNQVISGTNGNLINLRQILDPLKHQAKGRPPSKRLKSSHEQSGNKSKNKDQNEHVTSSIATDMGRKCGLCGENGHYCNTCSMKT
ncbi:hypothetical protein Glove_275g100 [Diversispora epigaea]|uniref:Uncharacterized protein n=1 Tax=Diversispora epigaea TaxID=1348612 RepID=A0A397I791_9GLOM|nr:hypothetical protein Glove_275g101 [Diversispora epigaea]RHZ70139.1 hypothetical protein Glove_275g100 [Diversispora epigaea]